MLALDPNWWSGRPVFVSGHTGFKGSWMAHWLREMGAEVTGYSLAPSTSPNLFSVLGLAPGHEADICDADRLSQALSDAQPEVVLHLAAQAIVRESYDAPVATFASNVMGTANLLDAIRRVPSVKSCVIVTSDKCYENREWPWPYRETDHLGGHDPYSASKAAAEIVAASMRKSFFSDTAQSRHPARIVTVRAGNVIGGGDWSVDRLVPDIVRGATTGSVHLRNPQAVRPWQHVLEPIAAYLGLGQALATGALSTEHSAFNIGPAAADTRTVQEVASFLSRKLGGFEITMDTQTKGPHEARTLRLDCSLAETELQWSPVWGFDMSMSQTADWYAAFEKGEDMRAVSTRQIMQYIDDQTNNTEAS